MKNMKMRELIINRIRKDFDMTVYELHKLTTKWLYEGYGDKTLYQCYDCNI